MTSKALQKPPASLSKGEIYNKYMAARRTQMRRRAQATTQREDLIVAAGTFAAGAVMGAGFQQYPSAERVFRDASGGGGVDTKLLLGLGATALAMTTRGLAATFSTVTAHSALALAGADLGRSMAVDS